MLDSSDVNANNLLGDVCNWNKPKPCRWGNCILDRMATFGLFISQVGFYFGSYGHFSAFIP